MGPGGFSPEECNHTGPERFDKAQELQPVQRDFEHTEGDLTELEESRKT